MEEIFAELPAEFEEEIADLLEEAKLTSIKAYVRDLIAMDITARKIPLQTNTPSLVLV